MYANFCFHSKYRLYFFKEKLKGVKIMNFNVCLEFNKFAELDFTKGNTLIKFFCSLSSFGLSWIC